MMMMMHADQFMIRRSIACKATSNQTIERKAVKISPPYHIVITGSTKGVGRALAEEFLRAGDKVVISSRRADAVDSVVKELSDQFGSERVRGIAANVAKAEDVRKLSMFASKELGKVDIWINNAGSNAYAYNLILDSSDEDLREIVETNLLGTVLCCREAVSLMSKQEQGGHLFNMDGAGADGGATPRFATYGATKRSLGQFSLSLQAELKEAKIKNVGIHNLSPGMVTTELLMSGATTPVAKFFINCLAEEPKDVASYLVPLIRRVPESNINPLSGSIDPSYPQFLTKTKAYTNILKRIITGERKNRFVQE